MRKYLLFCLIFCFFEAKPQNTDFTDAQLDYFASIAISKVYDFHTKISTIVHKDSITKKPYDEEIRQEAIKGGIVLFEDENKKIQVNSLRYKKPTDFKIREYLNRLKAYIDKKVYEKIAVEWTKINYISNFKKGRDGKYTATISIEQIFRGYRKNGDNLAPLEVAYADVTKKDIEVSIVEFRKKIDGEEFVYYDAMLGNIFVTETYPIQ